MACPPLRIPFPEYGSEIPPNPTHLQENWKAMERWASAMLKCTCQTCGGSEIYCSVESIEAEVVGGVSDAVTGTGQTVTLTTRSTIGVAVYFAADSTEGPFVVNGRLYEGLLYYIDLPGSVGVEFDGSWYANSSTGAAITLDPGTYTFAPTIDFNATVDATYTVTVRVVLTVAADTDENCFSGIE